MKDSPINGQFYSYELTPVIITKNTLYKIDKIIRSRIKADRREHVVRWLGYGPDFDSWISASDIKKI